MPWQVGDYAAEGDTPFAQGSFGTVWAARRLSDGAKAALKLVLLTSAVDSRDKLAAERRGAILQQRFEQAHGMVPKVYDYGEYGHDFYIAMELVEGGALADLIQRGSLPPRIAAEHAVCICDFLDKAHRFETTIEGNTYERIVHADLKPAHVLMPHAGTIKVLDFGIAKALANTSPVTTNNWSTTHYAPPERLDSAHVNEQVDFWSLGVMLYEMVSGHRPYSRLEGNISHLERAIRTNEPRDALPPSCPPHLAAIINKLLAYQVDRRYQTAAAIRSDLELFLSNQEPAATREYATQPTMPVRQVMESRAVQVTAAAVPATDPLPPGVLSPVGVIDSLDPAARRSAAPRRIDVARRVAWMIVLLSLVGLIAIEGVAWVAAERFRGEIEALDGPGISEKKQVYDRIRRWSVLHAGLRARVNRPLLQRLVSLADAVIVDYRRDQPTVGRLEWRQANDALKWALELRRGDAILLAKQLDCDGHVSRTTAQTQPPGHGKQQTYAAAIEKFKRAAELDKTSFDPYLGISPTAIYGLDNVDEAVASIKEAESRGYQVGRREHAQLGDGYLRRAERSRLLAARTLSGDQRRRELESARSDYGRCIELFDPIVGFARAAQNLEVCKRQLAGVTKELDASGVRP